MPRRRRARAPADRAAWRPGRSRSRSSSARHTTGARLVRLDRRFCNTRNARLRSACRSTRRHRLGLCHALQRGARTRRVGIAQVPARHQPRHLIAQRAVGLHARARRPASRAPRAWTRAAGSRVRYAGPMPRPPPAHLEHRVHRHAARGGQRELLALREVPAHVHERAQCLGPEVLDQLGRTRRRPPLLCPPDSLSSSAICSR